MGYMERLKRTIESARFLHTFLQARREGRRGRGIIRKRGWGLGQSVPAQEARVLRVDGIAEGGYIRQTENVEKR